MKFHIFLVKNILSPSRLAHVLCTLQRNEHTSRLLQQISQPGIPTAWIRSERHNLSRGRAPSQLLAPLHRRQLPIREMVHIPVPIHTPTTAERTQHKHDYQEI